MKATKQTKDHGNKKPEVKVDELQQSLAEMEAKWKRALADYQNLEKRVVQDRIRFTRMANVGLIEKLLSVLDNMELAQTHLQDSGLAMVLKEFHEIFNQEGVEMISPVGDEFDPTTMECVETVPGDTNKVITVQKPGYKIETTIIRPAKVCVGNSEINNTKK